MTTLAPKLPWSHAYAGGFPRMGGQSLVSDADAQDYLNRVKAADGAAVEVGVAQAIDAFVKGCKADNAGYAGDPTRTNWGAIQACCIMAGARTISGALVPLKRPYVAELVNINALPTPTIDDFGGSAGVWTSATRTMSNTPVGSNVSYPRFTFAVAATVGKRYRVTGVLAGDIGDVHGVRLGGSGSVIAVDPSTGAFDFVATCPAANMQFLLDGTRAPSSVRIESLSIREDSFTPTAQGGWTASDYSRGGTTPGLKGNGTTLYLDTNRASDADGQDDRHRAIYVSQVPSPANRCYLGAYTPSPSWLDDIYHNSSNQTLIRASQSSGSSVANASNAAGLAGYSRASSASVSARIYGASTTPSVASVAPSSYSPLVFSRREGAAVQAGVYSDARISFYSIGAALDLAALDARVSTLMAAIQAFLP